MKKVCVLSPSPAGLCSHSWNSGRMPHCVTSRIQWEGQAQDLRNLRFHFAISWDVLLGKQLPLKYLPTLGRESPASLREAAV